MTKKIEDVISEKGFYAVKPKGMSMYPMLKPDCSDVLVVKIDAPLNIYDVPLYKRDDGKYVLHRILGKDSGGFICCGDNQTVLEHNVTEDMIVGRLESWYKNGKKHTVSDKGYKRYVWFWCKSLKRRSFFLALIRFKWRLRGFCGGVYRKVFKRKVRKDG